MTSTQIEALDAPQIRVSSCYAVLTGVDTLEVSHHNMLCSHVLAAICEAKASAKESGQPEPIEINGVCFEVLPYGGKQGFDLIVRNPDLMLMIRRRKAAIETMPSVMAALRSAWLNESDWTLAYAHFEHWAAGILDDGGKHAWQISRVDLFADFQGWIPKWSDLYQGDRRCYSGAGRLKAFPVFEGARLQTFKAGEGHKRAPIEDTYQGERIGKDRIVMRMYDKTAEIAQASGKLWFHDLWAQHERYDPEQPTWRIEFQLRREALLSFRHEEAPRGVRNVRQLAATFGSLWRYLTGEKIGKSRGFISLRRPTYTKVKPKRLLARIDQWKLHKSWKAIRLFALDAEPIRRVNTRNLRSAEALAPAAEGYNATMLAHLTLTSDGDLSALARKMAGVDGVRERYGRSLARVLEEFWRKFIGKPIEEEAMSFLITMLVDLWVEAKALNLKLANGAVEELDEHWPDWWDVVELEDPQERLEEGFELTRGQMEGFVLRRARLIREEVMAEGCTAIHRNTIERLAAQLMDWKIVTLAAAEYNWLTHCSKLAEKARERRDLKQGMKGGGDSPSG